MNETLKIVIIYSLFGLFSVGFSFVINGLFIKFSRNLGMRNLDESLIRWGSTSKPAFGGISFFVNFLFSIIFFFMLSSNHSMVENIKFIGLVVTAAMGFLIGLADDAFNTKPGLKFAGQLSCGVILFFTGTSIHFFENEILNFFITVFWIVGIMNSINMLDNMDAITTTVSMAIILSALIVLAFLNSFYSIQFVILSGVMCALIGFLFYNWNPSKMYMGDTGSQFLGVLLSAIAIDCFWNTPFDDGNYSQTKQLLLTITVFIVPIIDTTTVTINRLLKGKSPFVGGRDHTTHHLSYMGLSDKMVAILLFALSLVSCVITYFIIKSDIWSVHQAIYLSIYLLIVFIALFSLTKLKRENTHRK